MDTAVKPSDDRTVSPYRIVRDTEGTIAHAGGRISYRRAIAAGAASVQEPVKKGDEDRRRSVKDAGGRTWWIATRVD
jgi:hypothetical protein